MDRNARRRQAKDDERILARGIDAQSDDPAQTTALARQLYVLLERAKRDGDIVPPVRLLHTKIEATLNAGKPLPLACKLRCSHCCHSWVSVPAPEVLYIVRRIRAVAPIRDRIAAADGITKNMNAAGRMRTPVACPMLEGDLCAIYEIRPLVCRFAASANAEICRRVFRNASGENIPAPTRNMKARGAYALALAMAMQRAGFPHHYYEFNAALARALERDDAERAWTRGEDIFAGVPRDPTDALSHPQVPILRQQAFGY
jgi:hypothetical protein